MTAVAPVVVNGNGLWVGWPGMHLEDPKEPIPESDPNDITPTAGLKSNKVILRRSHFEILQPEMLRISKKIITLNKDN